MESGGMHIGHIAPGEVSNPGCWLFRGYYTVFIYEELFFQNALSTNPKIEVAMEIPSSVIMFWTKALHKYVHICTYIRM